LYVSYYFTVILFAPVSISWHSPELEAIYVAPLDNQISIASGGYRLERSTPKEASQSGKRRESRECMQFLPHEQPWEERLPPTNPATTSRTAAKSTSLACDEEMMIREKSHLMILLTRRPQGFALCVEMTRVNKLVYTMPQKTATPLHS